MRLLVYGILFLHLNLGWSKLKREIGEDRGGISRESFTRRKHQTYFALEAEQLKPCVEFAYLHRVYVTSLESVGVFLSRSNAYSPFLGQICPDGAAVSTSHLRIWPPPA